MRYVVVCVVNGEAGDFNNNLRKELLEKLSAKSSKLPAHFTINSPFEYKGEITELNNVLEAFSKNVKAESYMIDGYDHFDDRVVYMKVNMSPEAKDVHDRLIDMMSTVPYIEFEEKDGKDKIFHVTLASKRLRPLYHKVWEYVHQYPCEFKCYFDNVTIFKWKEETWKVYREFKFKG
ncbi:MAG: 2'-5' RNA ligase family protein [Clostridium sp.]|uniref:2'-5' RNA ligase family protein n=1 Tax=Clostridium sp. TaxID=1506 RepID=UPI0025C6E8C8|nr:2'-5' RNA ligase family protein [Clostridium sp.]MCE5220699.1 2'-5' RNA ligase family protein [Clostridium sp.]